MIHIVNDLHGSKKLIDEVAAAISRMRRGDTIVINGDGAGARGPVMNNLIKIYYEVRRGETSEEELYAALEAIIGEKPDFPKEWIFDSVHGGLFRALLAEKYQKFASCMEDELSKVLKETIEPLSEAAKKAGVKLVYVPGNGEITPRDFLTSRYNEEFAVDPEDRFYHKLNKEGFFEEYGIEYVPYVAKVDGAVLISTDLLDVDVEVAKLLLKDAVGDDVFKVVIAHYPPAISPIGGAFDFWTPNKTDIKRTDALRAIVDGTNLDKNAQFFFGHIHLGVMSDEMASYPATMGFFAAKHQCIWVKPGTVITLKGSL